MLQGDKFSNEFFKTISTFSWRHWSLKLVPRTNSENLTVLHLQISCCILISLHGTYLDVQSYFQKGIAYCYSSLSLEVIISYHCGCDFLETATSSFVAERVALRTHLIACGTSLWYKMHSPPICLYVSSMSTKDHRQQCKAWHRKSHILINIKVTKM